MKQRIEFEVLSGALDGHVFTFNVKKVNLGRGPENEISLPDDSKIRKQSHVVFKAGRNGNWHLKNNAKRNVTVDGERVTGETAITAGQMIKVGNTVLTVVDTKSPSTDESNVADTPDEGNTVPEI